MANPKSFLANQLEKLNTRHQASKKCECPATGLSLALSKLVSDTVDEPFPGYENLIKNLKDMLSQFADQLEETNKSDEYNELYRLIEICVKNLEEAIELAPKPIPVKSAVCMHDRRPISRQPKVLGAYPESTVYSAPRYALNEMCQEGLDELVKELTATLKTFSNLPPVRIAKNLGCVVRAIKACRQALERAPGICPDEVVKKTDKGTTMQESKYSEADERQILLESGLLTASEMELLLSGAPLTDAMKKKLGMALAMQENADKDLLMNSGLLTASEMEILRRGGEWTDAMKAKLQQLKDKQQQADMDKFLNSGLLTESEMEILRSGGEWTEEMKRKFAQMKLKEKDEEDRKKLLESGLLTESEMAILLAGGDLTEAMRNKLLAINTPGLSDSMRRLLASGALTDSEKALLLAGGTLTDAMKNKLEEQRKKDEIQRLIDSGLLSESEKALLLAGGELTDAMKQKLTQMKDNEALATEGKLPADQKAKTDEVSKLTERKSEVNCGKKGKEEKPPPPCSVTYRLSDPKFITLGYTVLPTEQIMYQQEIYFGCFAKVNDPRFGPDSSTQKYKSGIPFLEVDKKTGSERILYPDGQIAIEYHDNKKTNIGKYTVYGPGPAGYSVLGIFDTLGYGAVYGRCVTTRLSYSQRGGILYETKAKCPVRWSWLTSQRPPKFYVYRDTNLPIIFKVPKKGKKDASKKSTGKTKSDLSSKNKKGAKEAIPQIVRKVFDPAIEIFEQAALDIIEQHTILEPVPVPVQYKVKDVLRPMKPIVIHLNDNIKLTIKNQQNIFLEMSAEDFSTRIDLGVILDKSIVMKQALLKVENITPGVNMLTEAMGPPKSPSVLQILGILGANRMSCNQEARRKNWVRPKVPIIPNPILWKMV